MHLNVINIQRKRRAHEHEDAISFATDIKAMILNGEIYIHEKGASIADHLMKLLL